MGHVAVLFNGKEFIFHLGCAFHPKPILDAGLVAGRESKDGPTAFFTPVDPRGDEVEEEFGGDLSKPRKVHHKTKWTHCQNDVCWIHLARAQEMEPAVLAIKVSRRYRS